MNRDELWQQEAKKLGGESLVEVIVEIRDGQTTVLERLDQMDNRHIASETAIAKINGAFPASDTEGHRRYHQLIIDNTEAKRNLTKAIKEKTISGLIWSAVVWGASEIWSHLPKLFER